MKVGPDIALVASLLGDPARANMLTALLAGQALTAGELAREAGVTPQTASSHLSRLEKGGLVIGRKQGRHSYFVLSGDDVAAVLEGLMNLAARTGHARTRPGPKEPALRRARVCYDHLAGDLGVAMLDSLIVSGRIDADLQLTAYGEAFFTALGIDLAALKAGRRPLCKACLDWSVRRSHLAGSLGAAVLDRLYALGWARRVDGERVVAFSEAGERKFVEVFGLA
ncbi:MAG: winged helix-turn-helix domain-containing protein [Caulobacter sp.]|nr:winged helix-turn-helix domain-containing protein [Caulobacter sp.]